MISKLIGTAPNGKQLKQKLPLGGFGISRYKLDAALKEIAVNNKVDVFENCKVADVSFNNDFTLQTSKGEFTCRICCGSYGKRSNLDVKWKRNFIDRKAGKLNNYIGVKYHVQSDLPSDTIALHNFKNGYCGISRIEDGKYCLCYLTTAANLKEHDNSIDAMQAGILYQNPHLKNIFEHSKILYDTPVTISQVSFDKKSQVEDHVLLLGDAAGMITPLCGNGMSMALHGSKIAAEFIGQFLKGEIKRAELEIRYTQKWRSIFGKRLATGRFIQSMFGKTWVTNSFISFMKTIPFLTKALIRQTHGKPF
jgi:menaquinone-9 beta-reductase